MLTHIDYLREVMYMCENEEEKDIIKMIVNPKQKQTTPKTSQIPSDSIEKLVQGKTVIVCKDGVAKIDSDHPDYNFWMED